MNRKDLIDYRNNKNWYLKRIDELKERKLTLGKLTSIYGDSGNKGSRSVNDKIAEDLAELMDNTDEYLKKLNELDKKNLEVINILDRMSNTTYRNVLYDKHIIGKDLQQIADDPIYKFKDYKYACNIHGYALKEFDETCKKYNLFS